MSDNPSLAATDPRFDASVHASAGTGKTWLLVTRVLRLLLAGASAECILAVTFTRKAAAEMESRIMERLHELACAEPENLVELLTQAGIDPEPGTQTRVTQLYEQVLRNPRRLRCTTFHAFCQDLLQRFPLEAGVAPGFEVVEKTGQLEQAAYDALLTDSIRAPDDPVTQALDRLTTGCDSLDSAQQALRSFLAQRSDWWAWTTGENDPLAFAVSRLTDFLDIDPATDPLAGYPDDIQRARHQAFAKLLRANTTSTNTDHAELIERTLDQNQSGEAFLEAIIPAYLTGKGERRARKSSAAQIKRLGPEREERFLSLHEDICAELLALRDAIARRNSLVLNTAWYRTGSALLEHYQRIKREQRVFDFADLEWRACKLLNHSEQASWVQYKLDARIDHLLVDEFQDTNPTQWRLLLPLLEELAAGDSGRQRSVFLVGDRKQSIYSFRRANPTLLETASGWLEKHRAAQRFPLNHSRRSAQAVMECVNRVFSQAGMQGLLADFELHDTHLAGVYGYVELLPLSTGMQDDESDAPAPHEIQLRNPLHEPRISGGSAAFLDEGRAIASTIRRLLEEGATVEKDGSVRPAGYGDIMILLRQRTHAGAYEQALREAGIPCLGASRGLLLENLEVRDLVALLTSLISPYDNLALAQALRSPLFDLDSEQLLTLCDNDSHWYAQLEQLAMAGVQPWKDIYGLLAGWRLLAGQLPVHDLLDRIFHEGEVIQRYEAAFPPALLPRIRASFTRFIELALELDNGRYPSLPRFLDLLARLRESDQDQPDESAPDDSHGDRVRLMTVHAAKGLEAPVVFLADAATVPKDRSAWSGCVDWPENAERPELIVLAARNDVRDSRTQGLLDARTAAQQREDANLLYVALTRARQYLFISGSAKPNAGNTSWYGQLETALADCTRSVDGHPCISSGKRRQPDTAAAIREDSIVIDSGLAETIKTAARDLPIAPSRLALASEHTHTDVDGRERGIALHLMLDHLTRALMTDSDTLYLDIANRLQRGEDDAELQEWWNEARATVAHPALSVLYDPAQYTWAFNEAPVQYKSGERMVYGVIDRLVVTDGSVLVIDYKSHSHADAGSIPQLVDDYRPQLDCYTEAAARLWPGRTIRTALLFTACAELVWLDGLQSPADNP